MKCNIIHQKKDKINTKLWGYIKFKNTAFLLAFLASALAFSKRSFSSNSASKRLRLRGERLLMRDVHFVRAIYKKFAFVTIYLDNWKIWRLMSTCKKNLRLKGGRLESGENMLVEVILIYFLGIFLGPIIEKSSMNCKKMSPF